MQVIAFCFLTVIGKVIAEECEKICTLIPGACSSKASYCEGGHACHDLFWMSNGILCNHATPGCTEKPALLWSEAANIVSSGNRESIQGPSYSVSVASSTVSKSEHDVALNDAPATTTVAAPGLGQIRTGMKGIKNLGATCHIGAAMQILLHSTAFRAALAADGLGPAISDAQKVYKQVRIMREQMYDDNFEGALDPTQLQTALRDFNGGEGFDNKASDAHDTFAVILDGLISASARLADLLFLETQAKCICTASVSERPFPGSKEVVQLVAIPDPNNPCRLNEMLTTHFAPQSVDVNCETCRRSHVNTVVSEIRAAPQLLVVMIKRYDFGRSRKLMTSVNIPFGLNLREVAKVNEALGDVNYRLIGILRHTGDHYVADYWNEELGSWVHANDSVVHAIAGLPTNSGHEPFLLFFERK